MSGVIHFNVMSNYELTQILLSVLSLLILIHNSYSITIVHNQTNSMKDELVNEVRVASIAKGRLEEKLDSVINRNGKVDQAYHKEV